MIGETISPYRFTESLGAGLCRLVLSFHIILVNYAAFHHKHYFL
jgi:hypothetical protein